MTEGRAPFEPQNELERSLMQATRDPAHRPQFYRDLMSADLYIEQEATGQPAGRRTLQPGETVRIRPIDWQGRECLPVYSSLLRLEATLTAPGSYLALNARNLMELTRGAGLILNPGAAYGKELTPPEIASLLDGTMGQPQTTVTAEASRVLVAQPRRYPTELVAALSECFRQMPQVRAAYLAHFHNPADRHPPHTLIGIEATGDWDTVLQQAGTILNTVTVPDPPIDVVQMIGKAGLAPSLRAYKPFYQRKRFVLF